MIKAFKPESPFMNGLEQVINTIYVGMLWLLFSLPVITIGASSCAAYYTMKKAVRGSRGYIFEEFFYSFKSNFRQGTIVWIAYIVLMVFIGFDMNIFKNLAAAGGDSSSMSGVAEMAQDLLLVIVAAATVLLMYSFAYIARFKQKTFVIIRSCAFIALKNMPNSTAILVILAADFILLFNFGFYAIILLPGINTYLMCVLLEKVFYKYISEEDRLMEDMLYHPDKYDTFVEDNMDLNMGMDADAVSGQNHKGGTLDRETDETPL